MSASVFARLRLVVVAVAVAAIWLGPGVARAQRGVDAELFHPALDSYGIFTVERAQTSHPWDFGFKFFFNYAHNPLRLALYDEASMMPQRVTILDRQIVLDFGAHLGLTSWLELVIDVPFSSQAYGAAYGTYGAASDPMIARTGFYAADPYTNVPPPDASPLDTRIGFKARLFRKGLFGMALAAVATLPFGDDSAFLGSTGFTFRPTLIADFTRGPLTIALNLGAVVRAETIVLDPHDVAAGVAQPRALIDVGDELTWSAGFAYRFVRWVGVAAELFGLVPLVHAAADAPKDYTLDVLGGLQLFPGKEITLAVGAGAGVLDSQRHDDFRVFTGLSWAPVFGQRGAVGGLDTDGDGIPDSVDQCPNEPEDKDGFEDDDGCPDPDNDQDGVPDRKDRCPNEPEDRDGFQDDDGCPESDNDGDGIPDAQDKCPNDPEDRDGFQDDDGCPDADNDGDGIPDLADKCPNEPETINGVDDDDGCPDTGGVVVTGTKIELPEQVQFEAGKATLIARSEKLLDQIADRIKASPNVKRIRIEGHTDDQGPPKKNQALSQARAEAVRDYLIKRGIEAERLQAVGYGGVRPLDPRKTAGARAKNRRVEFIIVEQR